MAKKALTPKQRVARNAKRVSKMTTAGKGQTDFSRRSLTSLQQMVKDAEGKSTVAQKTTAKKALNELAKRGPKGKRKK